MLKHLLKKIVFLLTALFLVVTLTFFLMHAIPGDPFSNDEGVPEEVLKSLYRYYHLDEPLFSQYLHYLQGVAKGDLGPSFKYQGRTANSIIADGFPISFVLGAEALFLALSFGVFFGTVASMRRGRWQDLVSMVVAVLGISVPSFIMATFLQYVFSMKLDLFPVARWGSFFHSVLPAFSLSAMPMAFIARLTRSNMVEVLQQDYILTARSKGISERQLVFKHVLRNTLLPVVSYVGPLCAAIFTGSFVVERVFGIPGLGQWFVLSVSNRDYSVIMALAIFYSAILMLCVYLVDVLYCLFDPRIVHGRI